mmetsp:Transcript_1271/g.1323  ORF Transcript_1271/g.1323 Transcript_1271/m.1323 type:complete len:93 (-) Transcript_1271:32-310(-)
MKQVEAERKRIIDKHITMRKHLEGMKESQSFILEQRRKANLERRKIIDAISEAAHNHAPLSLSALNKRGKNIWKEDEIAHQSTEKMDGYELK